MPKKLVDWLTPKDDSVQTILKRRGKPVAGIYVEGDKEFRSPQLQQRDPKHDPNPLED